MTLSHDLPRQAPYYRSSTLNNTSLERLASPPGKSYEISEQRSGVVEVRDAIDELIRFVNEQTRKQSLLSVEPYSNQGFIDDTEVATDEEVSPDVWPPDWPQESRL
jgi:hypothetical protein